MNTDQVLAGQDGERPEVGTRRLSRRKRLLFLAILLFFALLIAEGVGQVLLYYNYGGGVEAEDRLIQYDPDLGWRNIPTHFVRDRYGGGSHATHNADGLRALRDHSFAKPENTYRVACIGDSFTYGVCGDDETYPSFLADGNPGTEVLNMGVLGYGLDQVYLAYVRDGHKFDADLLVLGFIEDDLTRMARNTFLVRNPKPQVAIKDGHLTPCNVPVPRWGESAGRGWVDGFPTSTALFQLTHTVVDRITSEIDVQPLAERILEALSVLSRKKQQRFAVAYFPSAYAGSPDLSEDGPSETVLRLERFAASKDIAFFNLTAAFKERSRGSEAAFVQANGHYSVKGNRLIAGLLAAALRAWDPTFPGEVGDR